MKELWTRWRPITKLFNKYYIESIFLKDSFEIILIDIKDKNNKIRITDFAAPEVYRITASDYRWSVLSKDHGTDFYDSHTFFRVYNSSFLQWISDESCTISDARGLTHIAIVGSNFIIDIAVCIDPKFEHVFSWKNWINGLLKWNK